MADKTTENWPRDADDLVNGIPETVKAAKSMGHVPASGNDPEAQLRASKMLAAAGIEVPEGIQAGPITPADRRAAVERQNEYAQEAATALEDAAGWNPVKHAAAVERGEDPADAARRDAVESPAIVSKEDAAAERRAAAEKSGEDKSTTKPVGRAAPNKATTQG